MKNRFQKIREKYSEIRRDKNPHAKIYSIEEMCNDFYNMGFNISPSRIKKVESNTLGVKIDAEMLLAYKKKFNVSADWLIDNTVHTKHLTGDTASASMITGLSDESIQDIAELNKDDKFIFDKMIKNYCFLSCISDIRKLIAFKSLQPHVKIVFEEKYPEEGNPIDKELTDTINDESASHFFNESVRNSINGVIENTICDNELKEYFKEVYASSKIKGRPLTLDELARQMGISDETVKTSNGGDSCETT